MTREEIIEVLRSINTYWDEEKEAIEAAIAALQEQGDTINRQAAIDGIVSFFGFSIEDEYGSAVKEVIMQLPSAQPEIIRCRECVHGEQVNDDWWYCTGFGCQVGDEDGSGFCANAERKSGD